LTVALVSAEDIFLFKSVAGSTDDVDDVFALVQTGLDFDVIEAELQRQIDLLGQELFVSYVNEALVALDDAISRSELYERVDLSSNEVDEAIRSLESKGVVAAEDDRITKESEFL